MQSLLARLKDVDVKFWCGVLHPPTDDSNSCGYCLTQHSVSLLILLAVTFATLVKCNFLCPNCLWTYGRIWLSQKADRY